MVMYMKNAKLYTIGRPIANVLFRLLYQPKIIGKENIPKEGAVILAGNHKNNFDCLMLLCSTKRPIHFLAKIELFKGFKKILFNHLGLIPVDRQRKNPEALKLAEDYLKDNKIIGIFPEGTHNKTKDSILPFKIGAVKMAYDTNTPIVPFVIKGKYRLFFNDLQIEFLSPYYVDSDLVVSNKELEGIIKNKLEG